MLLWLSGLALARSWCASELVAHEWGVTVLRADGAAPQSVPMPSWLHTRPPQATAQGPAAEPVRGLPADSGIRTLPVVQVYAPSSPWGPAPLAVEVGFTQGEAALWYPQVDRLRSAAAANSHGAAQQREALLRARADRQPMRPSEGADLGPDPTRQLGWDALTLGTAPPKRLPPAEQPWVQALRAQEGALWLSTQREGERFLFYEADTREEAALVVARGETWRPGRPHYLLRNRSDWDVYDVLIVSDGLAWSAPRVPAGATAGFLLDEPLDAAATAAWLREQWGDAVQPAPPAQAGWSQDDCVMMRDPAIPVEAAEGHRLYAAEVDVLLSVWADRLLAAEGAHLVYREDTEALDTIMPVSLYTDMYHFIQWRRLGVVLVEGVSLP